MLNYKSMYIQCEEVFMFVSHHWRDDQTAFRRKSSLDHVLLKEKIGNLLTNPQCIFFRAEVASQRVPCWRGMCNAPAVFPHRTTPLCATRSSTAPTFDVSHHNSSSARLRREEAVPHLLTGTGSDSFSAIQHDPLDKQ